MQCSECFSGQVRFSHGRSHVKAASPISHHMRWQVAGLVGEEEPSGSCADMSYRGQAADCVCHCCPMDYKGVGTAALNRQFDSPQVQWTGQAPAQSAEHTFWRAPRPTSTAFPASAMLWPTHAPLYCMLRTALYCPASIYKNFSFIVSMKWEVLEEQPQKTYAGSAVSVCAMLLQCNSQQSD